jgi:hypothetical protein
MGEMRNAYKILFGRSEGKIPIGRPKCRWEDDVKNVSSGNKVGRYGLGRLAEDRDQWQVLALVNTVIKL